jgi:hypothetical protein
MEVRKDAFKRGHAEDWTRERVEQLGKQELMQLRENADRLGETELSALCDEVLKLRPKTSAKAAAPVRGKAKQRRLISRSKAFEARGVFLQDSRGSWGGVRKSDGMVVMNIWAAGVDSAEGSCKYLLWSPNVKGSRPWSDSPAGKERLEHCKLALQNGVAEGLLVHGDPLEGHLPEDRARSVHGVDPETVLRFQVEKRGAEYWAVWGKKTV